MNITSIGTGYIPLKSSQNFGTFTVLPEIMKICNLNEDDINKLNTKCRKTLDVFIFKTIDSNNNEICKAHVRYNGNDLNDLYESFDINTANNDKAKQENNTNFKNFIARIIKDYKDYCGICF